MVTLDVHDAPSSGRLDQALAAISNGQGQALIVTPSPFAVTQRGKLIEYAAAKNLPAVFFDDSFVEAGGFMSYGPSIADSYRRAASHVAKILKGAKPGDLPVELPTKFDLVVNRRAAQALGINLRQSFLIRVDRLVE